MNTPTDEYANNRANGHAIGPASRSTTATATDAAIDAATNTATEIGSNRIEAEADGAVRAVRRARSSRQRFEDYQRRFRAAERGEPLATDIDAGEELASSKYRDRRSGKGRGRSAGTLIRAFWDLLEGQRTTAAVFLSLLTFTTVLGLLPPAATKIIIDNVINKAPLPPTMVALGLDALDRKSLLWAICGAVFAISLVKMVVQLGSRWLATRTAKRLQNIVRKRLWEHAIRLPMKAVHELRSGSVVSLLREDAGSTGDLVFGFLYNPWRAIVQLVGSLAILAYVDWRLLLGTIAILPAIWVSHRTWISRIRPRFRDVRSRRSEIDALSTEIFGGMRVVRAFGRQRTETGRAMTGNHLMARQELSVWWWQRTIELVWGILIPLCSGLLMLYGGLRVIDEALTVGELTMFLVYLLMLLQPLAVLAESAAAFQNSLSGLDRVLDLLDQDSEPGGQGAILDRNEIAGAIEIDNVTFSYDPDDPALAPAVREVSLAIRPGQVVALVGPSGAGKTTLCNLVARFYEPTLGTIRLDGRDVSEIDLESYRQILGVVEQDVFLFDGTVAENIAYGRRDATMEQVREAARLAFAEAFIDKLPQGFASIIGERGVKLSGGQRQRIAIARAILADPKLLILDEATSNLDSESERAIQRGLETLLADRTSLIIAHRLSTIQDADLIVVMRDGGIVETGTHEELLVRDGQYAEMVRLQTLGEVEELIG